MTDNRVSFSYTDTQRKILKIPLDFKFKQLPLCRCNWVLTMDLNCVLLWYTNQLHFMQQRFRTQLASQSRFSEKERGDPVINCLYSPFTLRRNLYAQNKRQEKLDSKRHALCCRPNLFRMVGLILILTTPQRPPFIGFCRWGEQRCTLH